MLNGTSTTEKSGKKNSARETMRKKWLQIRCMACMCRVYWIGCSTWLYVKKNVERIKWNGAKRCGTQPQTYWFRYPRSPLIVSPVNNYPSEFNKCTHAHTPTTIRILIRANTFSAWTCLTTKKKNNNKKYFQFYFEYPYGECRGEIISSYVISK